MRITIGLVLLAGAALPGLGQGGNVAAQAIDLQWAGCWDLQVEEADAATDAGAGEGERATPAEGEPLAGATAPQRRLCVESSDATLTVVTMIDGAEVRRDQLHTDGRSRPVEDGGCSGTEQAVASADGHRLYTSADLVCEGGSRRVASGISALVSPDTWIDIQVVRVGEEREVMVRRFSYNEPESSAIWEQAGRGDLSLAARTERTAAAAALDTDDVIEAVRTVDAAAVEALLVESEASFAIDAGVLIALADAEVPGEVIDLMLALSFPDYFLVDEQPVEPQQLVAYGYPVGYYGYWSPSFSPFGWSYYYPWYSVGGRPLGRPPVGRRGGRVVKGQGYARVLTNPDSPKGGFGRFLRRGGSSKRTGGRVTPGGASSGNGASSVSGSGSSSSGKGSSGKTRTAKRRNG